MNRLPTPRSIACDFATLVIALLLAALVTPAVIAQTTQPAGGVKIAPEWAGKFVVEIPAPSQGRWSPDGQRIAWTYTDLGPASGMPRPGHMEDTGMCVLDLATGKTQKLSLKPADNSVGGYETVDGRPTAASATWLDDKTMIVLMRSATRPSSFCKVAVKDGKLENAGVWGKLPKAYQSGFILPLVAPGGHNILLESFGQPSLLLDANGKEVAQIKTSSGAGGVMWSNDGKDLIVARGKDLLAVAARNGKERKLVSTNGEVLCLGQAHNGALVLQVFATHKPDGGKGWVSVWDPREPKTDPKGLMQFQSGTQEGTSYSFDCMLVPGTNLFLARQAVWDMRAGEDARKTTYTKLDAAGKKADELTVPATKTTDPREDRRLVWLTADGKAVVVDMPEGHGMIIRRVPEVSPMSKLFFFGPEGAAAVLCNPDGKGEKWGPKKEEEQPPPAALPAMPPAMPKLRIPVLN